MMISTSASLPESCLLLRKEIPIDPLTLSNECNALDNGYPWPVEASDIIKLIDDYIDGQTQLLGL